MPLFEFSCEDCSHHAELLVARTEKPACPKCGSKKMEISRDTLDADLDSYMMRDEKTAKTSLDADLENYMMGTGSFPTQIGN